MVESDITFNMSNLKNFILKLKGKHKCWLYIFLICRNYCETVIYVGKFVGPHILCMQWVKERPFIREVLMVQL